MITALVENRITPVAAINIAGRFEVLITIHFVGEKNYLPLDGDRVQTCLRTEEGK